MGDARRRHMMLPDADTSGPWHLLAIARCAEQDGSEGAVSLTTPRPEGSKVNAAVETDNVAEDQSGRRIDAAFWRSNDQHPGTGLARLGAGGRFSGCGDRVPDGLIQILALAKRLPETSLRAGTRRPGAATTRACREH